MITYRPNGKRVMDYLVYYQCGFLLRHSATLSEARGDVTATEEGLYAVNELVDRLATVVLGT
jgi:hypothetical protein